jgi:RNA polymerase sigma-70 factor (sigma-E family)
MPLVRVVYYMSLQTSPGVPALTAAALAVAALPASTSNLRTNPTAFAMNSNFEQSFDSGIHGENTALRLTDNERIAEQATFETFFRATYPRMVRLATMMVGSPSAAEDLTQDAYAKLYARFAKVDDPHAYLRTAVVNGCRGSFRRRVVADRFLPLLVTDAATTDHDSLLSILDRLPARQKAAIVLKFCDRCSEAEIAETLGCRPGTVKSLLSRGLETLRQEQAND